MLEKITLKEKRFLWAWNVLLLLLVLTPHFVAFLHSSSLYHYSYLTENETVDLHAYFAWIKQASDGRWLFSDLFATEPSNGFFHPIFLLMGKLVELHIPLVLVWYGMRILSNTFFIFSLYKLLVTLLPKISQRMWALVLITLGSGFGWLVGNLAADSAQAEATVIQLLRWPFIFTLALSILILAFRNVFLFTQTSNRKHLWLAALQSGLLGFIHLYDVVVLFLTVFLVLLSYILKHKALWGKKILSIFGPFFVFSLPCGVYYYWLFTHDWVFMANTQVALPGQGALYYLLGFGTLHIFAILAGFIYKKSHVTNAVMFFLLLWVASQGLLIFSPISFQRKLIMGLIIPVGILAGIGMNYVLETVHRARITMALKITLALGVLIIFGMSLPTNGVVLSKDIQNAQSDDLPYFIPDNMWSSLQWLDKQNKSEAVVASYTTGNIIPRYTGMHTFIGHWAQTLNIETKSAIVEQLYSNEISPINATRLLRQYKLTLLYYGPEEQAAYPHPWFLNHPGLLTEIYNEQGIKIYAIK